ncbi:MAG: hypothetical protein A2Y38_00370 [Spirochaetes bacterium GWB1_59_5]|nr:MAG: hypothetical protein A2Y38_00370 [Spirochaetes bacterium GWB1_59_5]
MSPWHTLNRVKSLALTGVERLGDGCVALGQRVHRLAWRLDDLACRCQLALGHVPGSGDEAETQCQVRPDCPDCPVSWCEGRLAPQRPR